MALEAVSPASAALPELAHLHLLAHLAGVPTEASLSYNSRRDNRLVVGAYCSDTAGISPTAEALLEYL